MLRVTLALSNENKDKATARDYRPYLDTIMPPRTRVVEQPQAKKVIHAS